MQTQKAVNRIIDSVWTLTYTLTPGTREIEILAYTWDDKDGWKNELQYPKFKKTENEDRFITHIEIKGITYYVKNPKHVFDY